MCTLNWKVHNYQKKWHILCYFVYADIYNAPLTPSGKLDKYLSTMFISGWSQLHSECPQTLCEVPVALLKQNKLIVFL